jgi:hypothetical protein
MMDTSWADRLALAGRIVAAGPQVTIPVAVADQVAAASADAMATLENAAVILPSLDPESGWTRRDVTGPGADQLAHLLAAILGCSLCIHLRRGGPQPATVDLATRRALCRRCIATHRKPVVAADACDLCDAHPVSIFTPLIASLGPVTFAGDLCDDCAAILCVDRHQGAL